MESSGFFKSLDEDRKYLARQFAEYFATFIGDGVFANPAYQLKVYQYEGMNVRINNGNGFMKGYWYCVDNDVAITTKTIPYNTTSTTMSVYVKMVLDEDEERKIQTIVSTDATVSDTEKILAIVTVPPGATTITNDMIQDVRMDSTKCGFVKGLIDQIDTTDFFNQYTEALQKQLLENNKAFQEWWDTVRDLLDEDVAIQLQQQIGTLAFLSTQDKSNLVNAINEVARASGGVRIVNITQADYDVLENKQDGVLYDITDADEYIKAENVEYGDSDVKTALDGLNDSVKGFEVYDIETFYEEFEMSMDEFNTKTTSDIFYLMPVNSMMIYAQSPNATRLLDIPNSYGSVRLTKTHSGRCLVEFVTMASPNGIYIKMGAQADIATHNYLLVSGTAVDSPTS